MATPSGKNRQQQQATIRIVVMAAIVVCANVLASYFHVGLDLTQEKRFTLTEPTKKMLRNMPEVAVIDVYLKGEFPAGLQRLQEAIRERLRSFKEVAGSHLIFRFTDPFEGKTEKEKKQIAHDLAGKGVMVTELSNKDDDEYSSKPFFPYALVQYNGREMAIYLPGASGRGTEEELTNAEAMLEYKFANAINRLSKPTKPSIAYITGHGEPLNVKTYDMLTTLAGIYTLDSLDLTHTLDISVAYDAVIVNQPTMTFSGPEKLKIDQYIMRGGHVLWVMNALHASLDSFANSPQFIAMEYPTELDEVLFKYGVRVNFDLVEDMQCNPLPRVLNNGKPQLYEWVYFPKITPTGDHAIVKNMDQLMGGFSNTIDTISSANIQKTILLHTSKYSRSARAPVRVSLSMMSYPLKHEMFMKSYQPMAVLLEGKFHSVFENRLAPEYLKLLDSLKQPFKSSCDTMNSMIVTSVGELFSNGYTTKDGVLPLGYYQFTGEYFSNKAFLLNCLEYLTDHSGILEARSKDVKLRLLDKGRVKPEKSMWQVVNTAIPIAAVLVFASFYLFFRKRRYAVKKEDPKTSAPNA